MKFSSQLLTKKQFNNEIKPNHEAKYIDLVSGIFRDQKKYINNTINQILEPLIKQLEELNIIKDSNGRIVFNAFRDVTMSLYLFKYHLINAYKHTYIEGEYDFYLTVKIYSLKSVFVYWESFIDKIALPYFENFLEPNMKAKIKDYQIQREIKKEWKEYSNLINNLGNAKFSLLGDLYSFNDFSNHVKHRSNKIDTFLMEILYELRYKGEISKKNFEYLNIFFDSVYLTFFTNQIIVNEFIKKEFGKNILKNNNI